MNIEKEKIQEELVLHIDLPYHYLTPEELINYVNSINGILNVFNKLYFKEQSDIKLLIAPLQNGGIKQFFKISGYVIGLSFTFLNTELGASFIEGLTGNTPNYYAKKSGLLIKESIQYFIKKKPDELKDINKTIPHSKLINEALKNKNLFYNTALSNLDNKGFCFNNSYDFDIKRESYKDYIVDIEEDIEYKIQTKRVKITSPDSEGKAWRGIFIDEENKKENKESKSFNFLDEDFLKNNQYISTNETLFGQFLIEIDNKNNRNRFHLMRVLEYKNEKINEELTGDKITKIIKDIQLNDLKDDKNNAINKINKKDYKAGGQTYFDFIDK